MNAQTDAADRALASSTGSLSDAAVESLGGDRDQPTAESVAQALAEGPWLDELMGHVGTPGCG